MGILVDASKILSSSLGSLVYYLILLLAVEAALAMAWGEWRRSQRDQARRLMYALGGLLVVRLTYVIAALAASLGWIDASDVLPPLERFIDTVSIALLGWAFMPTVKRGNRTWDIVFAANVVVAVGVFIGFTLIWTQALRASGPLLNYNEYWQATIWGLWQIALLVLASVAVTRDRSEGWGTLLLAMIVMLVGRVLQLVAPMDILHRPGWDRLSNLIAYALIVLAVYQNIVVRLRVQSRHLQDISQASMDQIKSLLYLFEASQQMSASLDLSIVLDNAVKGISRALDADQCAIAFPEDGEAGQMRLVAIYNPGRQGRGEEVTFPLDYQMTVQQAMRRKKYVIVEESDNIQLKVLFALLGSSEVGPLLVQPLVDGLESIGAAIVGNSRSRRPFTPNEAKLCQSMAEQVVSAIRNARRYQGAQEKIAALTTKIGTGTGEINVSKEQIETLTERLTVTQADLIESRRREEQAREVRNALEIKLVSTRAEVEVMSERLAVVESDLGQAHANAEAQLRWLEEELARRQATWREDVEVAGWLHVVLQGMTAGVLIADAEDSVREANVAAELLLDWDGGELQGMLLSEVSDDERWTRAVATAAEGEAVRLTYQVGANTLLCDMAPLQTVPGNGQVRGTVVILQDITTEVELQRDQLETVGIMSSELRTPVTSIINYVDLLLSEAVGSIGDAQRKFLLRIKAAAERMIQMTNDLSGVATGEEQWTSPQCQPVDVARIIKRAVAGSSIQLEDKAITLELDLPEDLPSVQADPDYLRRVVNNLLTNAYLASSKGGRIEVWVAQSEGASPEPGYVELNGDEYVIVSIRDAGGGLTEDALNRVFDRARPSRTPQGLGESGAGLALVKALVEVHGGRLWVESESGVGTTFSFILPLMEQQNHS